MENKINHIPVDYIKVQVLNYDKQDFLDNDKFIFTPVLRNQDEIKYWWYENKNMTLKVYESGRIILAGSIHKYFNNGINNYNDFGYQSFLIALKQLESDFDVSISDLYIINLEYGVNIRMPFNTKEVLGGLIQHMRKDFELKISNARGHYYQAQHYNYFIKVYDKGKQFKQGNNLLRYEVKHTNWTVFRKQGVVTLSDFLKSDKTIFLTVLMRKWNEIIFCDPFIRASKKKEYCYKPFWDKLVDQKPSRQTFLNYRKSLKTLNNKFGLNVQPKIQYLIQSKIETIQ